MSEHEPDALAKWTRNDLVGRPIVYSINKNLESSHSFNENGALEIAMERSGEQIGLTNWKWMIDADGILVATCEEPKMTAKFKLLSRLDEGFEVEQSGETNGETILPTRIRWKYRQATN